MNQEEVKAIFDYRDGGLYWKHDRGSNAKTGNRAGRLLRTGYRSIHVSGRRYQEHRLVYLWHHGFMPAQIDHINRLKADNRIENLQPDKYRKQRKSIRFSWSKVCPEDRKMGGKNISEWQGDSDRNL